MAKDLELPIKITADTAAAARAERAIDGVADAVDELGDEAKQTERQLDSLNRELAQTNAKIKDLSARRASGDETVVGDLKKLRAVRAELQRIRKELEPAKEAAPSPTGGGSDRSRIGALLGAQGLGAQAVTAATARPLIVGIVGLVAANAPLIAGAVSAAVVAGLTSGVVAGGVVAAFQDPKVKAAGTNLAHELGSDLTVAGQMFVDPTIKAIGTIRAEWRREILPEIEGTFASATRFVQPLADAFTGFVEGILPGIRHIVDEAEPVIKVVERDLPALGRTLGDLFEDVGDSSESSAKALHDVLLTTETIVSQTGFWLKTLSEVYGIYSDIDFTVFGFVKKLQEAKDNSGAIWHEGATGAADLTAKVQDAADAMDELKEAFDRLNGKALDAREAESNYQAAIDAVTESVLKNGRTLDLNTEKGRANDQVLRDLVDATDERARAIYDNIAATGNLTGAEAAAAKVYADGRAQLIASAMQMGLTRKKAEELANQIMKIPSTWTTSVNLVGADKVRADVAAVQAELAKVRTNLTITIATAGSLGIQLFKPRAGGGDVAAGGAYLVGEHGPEPFFPSTNGYVMSNTDAKMAMSQGGGQSGGSRGKYLQPVALYINGRQIIDALYEHADDTNRTPADLWPARR